MTLDPQAISQVLAHLKAAENSLKLANHYASKSEPLIHQAMAAVRPCIINLQQGITHSKANP
jgi:hypothetical protein